MCRTLYPDAGHGDGAVCRQCVQEEETADLDELGAEMTRELEQWQQVAAVAETAGWRR